MNRNSHVRNYLKQAEQRAHQRTLSATGRPERSMGADGWLQRPSNYRPFTQDAEGGQFYRNADGGAPGAGAAAPIYSDPYIITVSNASAATVSDFDLWGSVIYLNTGAYTYTAGSLVRGAITVSSGMPDPITYYTMLNQLQNQPFTTGKITLLVLAGSNGQIAQPWTIKTFSSNGNFARKTLPNVIEPSQFQSGVINNFRQVDFDQETTLSLNILGSTVFQMLFYPLADINTSRALTGQNSARSYVPPPSNLPPQPVLIAQ